MKSIRWRMTSLYLIIIAVSLSTIGGYFIWRLEVFYMDNLKRHLQNEVKIMVELFSALQEEDTFAENVNAVCERVGRETGNRVTFVAAGGEVLGDSHEDIDLMENHLHRPEIQDALDRGRGAGRRFSATMDKDMYYLALLMDETDPASGFVRISVPLAHINENIAQMRLILVSWVLLALILAALLSLRFSRRLIKPLDEIGMVARAITSGDFDQRVQVQTEDELGVLGRTINRMGQTLKEKVQQISQEKSKLESVMSSMTSGVILCDSGGRINYINEAAIETFGVEGKKVVGLPLQSAIRNFLLYEKLQEVLKTGEMKSFELNLFFPETRVVQVHMVPITGGIAGDTGEEIISVLAVLHDITGIRSLERMRSEFVANVSHELRTPLTTIKGYAETLLEESNRTDPETVERILTIIDKEAGRLARLLKDLLNLSQIESSKAVMKKQKVDLYPVLEDAVSLLREQATEKTLHLEVEAPSRDLPTVTGDPDWLLQLFIDLLDNAIKYTPAGGRITLQITHQPGEVVVSITDTGIGIPAANLPYIFERFYRVDKARSRSVGGTGLGLAIVKHIVEAHNGRVEVQSTVGEGTTFHIHLPLEPPREP